MNIRRIAGIREEAMSTLPKLEHSSFLPKIQNHRNAFGWRKQSHEKVETFNSIFRRRNLESRDSQCKNEKGPNMIGKLLPQLNLTEFKEMNTLVSPIFISSRRDIAKREEANLSPIELFQPPKSTIQDFKQSLMFDRKAMKKKLLIKKIRKNIIKRKESN
ncbi:unnamed protein product [Moneuplotes crassus]|uniref:Uncharacterized protein n=1 Tax=Euplotes crassus TaxID=5936 RepID=A0AAD1XGS4_EUPCR|nr:unnamed protein product [Moneuplotes crassus]